jgi:hypothetical protein
MVGIHPDLVAVLCILISFLGRFLMEVMSWIDVAAAGTPTIVGCSESQAQVPVYGLGGPL